MDVKVELWAGVLGGVSLLGSYFCRKVLSSYLYQVPQFCDFSKLKDHLSSSPAKKSDVLVEGRVGSAYREGVLVSDYTYLPGAVKQTTVTPYVFKKSGELSERSNDAETVQNKALAEFNLWDSHGCFIRVRSVSGAAGLRQVLQMVHEARPANGYLTREYMLLFGTPLAAYGEAFIEAGPKFVPTVMFSPYEFGTSVRKLDYPNKIKASVLNFVSFVLLVFGGGVLVFSGISLLVRFFLWRQPAQIHPPQPAQPAQIQPPQPAQPAQIQPPQPAQPAQIQPPVHQADEEDVY